MARSRVHARREGPGGGACGTGGHVCCGPCAGRPGLHGVQLAHARDWPWASTRAHLGGKSDGLTRLEPVRERFPKFADLLALGPDDEAFTKLRQAESIGRPLGDGAFMRKVERTTKRILRPAKRGPKPKAPDPGGS